MEKAIIYARVSSREQELTGYSLPAQEKFLKEFAEKKQLSIEKIFSVSESASGKKQREVFNEMIVFANKNKIKVIICEKADRLTRNFRDMVAIDDWLDKDSQRAIHLVKDSLILNKNSRSQEKLNWGIRVLFAKNYIDNLSEETKKGQAEKISQGWLPTKPPLGYKTIGDEGHKIHIIDESKAPLLLDMFRLYSTKNHSIIKLTQIMYDKGLRSLKGNKIPKSAIHRLLSDPFYCGMLRWNNKIYEGKHQALVSKDLFNTVQQILKQKTTPKYRKHFTLFKSLLKCEECGGTITWESQKGHWYGHCNHYRHCTQKKFVRQEIIEHQVLKHFNNITIRDKRLADWVAKALKESHSDKIAFQQKCYSELNAQLVRLQNRADLLYNDRLDGRIDTAAYDAKNKEINAEKEKVLDALKRHNEADKEYFELGINIFELSQKAEEIFANAPEEKKRELLSIVFSGVSVDSDRQLINIVFQKPFEIIAQKALQMNNGSKLSEIVENRSENFEPLDYRREYVPETLHFGDELPGLGSNQEPSGPEPLVLPLHHRATFYCLLLLLCSLKAYILLFHLTPSGTIILVIRSAQTSTAAPPGNIKLSLKVLSTSDADYFLLLYLTSSGPIILVTRFAQTSTDAPPGNIKLSLKVLSTSDADYFLLLYLTSSGPIILVTRFAQTSTDAPPGKNYGT